MSRMLTLSALLVTACGLTSPGSGSRTLFVEASLSSDGSTPGSRIRVTVRSGSSSGEPVNNAEVAIRGGSLGRTLVPLESQSGRYRLEGFSWVEGFRLEVVRGTDVLEGSIDAPGATLISDPISDSTYRRADGLPLVIRWQDARHASAAKTQVHLSKAKVERDIPPGIFEMRIEPNQLRAEDKEEVTVTRTNEVALAGGVAGSILSATTEHHIEFRVE
jgi:hypothetical protein